MKEKPKRGDAKGLLPFSRWQSPQSYAVRDGTTSNTPTTTLCQYRTICALHRRVDGTTTTLRGRSGGHRPADYRTTQDFTHSYFYLRSLEDAPPVSIATAI